LDPSERSVELGAPFNMDIEKSRDWVDPTVGVVLHAPLTDGCTLRSPRTWRVRRGLGLRLAGLPDRRVDITRHASVEVGWRILDENYATGDGPDRFEYDMQLQGPAAGLAFRF
jgi:hypothetical protein